MAEATSLKQRTTASNFLKEAIRDFTRYRDTQNPSMRLIRQKLKKLNDAKDDLKSGKDVDLNEMKELITPLLDEAIVF